MHGFLLVNATGSITNQEAGKACSASGWPLGRGFRPAAVRANKPANEGEGMGCRGRGFLLATCEL